MIRKNIDNGNNFDWGKASEDYVKYRDIYPEEIYRRLIASEICTKGQAVLDVGTGSGVLPRNMYRYGADFTACDISPEQINQAEKLSDSQGMKIKYISGAAEDLSFSDNSFDVITACQCFFYFNHAVFAKKASRWLKKGGKLAIIYFAWLPFEDKLAAESERLVLKYNPDWSGKEEIRHPIDISPVYSDFFEKHEETVFDIPVHFTRETWAGRIRACRGVGASLNEKEKAEFDKEHWEILNKIAPEEFDILHYCAITILQKK